MTDTNEFYDPLAEVYHLIYENWEASIERQGSALDAILRPARIVADVACGIGTQSLGLAARGYRVIASDISEPALQRARREAGQRNLDIDFRRDDMTRLTTYDDRSVDALIACDNAVPHLLSDEQIRGAFRQFYRVIRSGGTCVISVRDYAAIPREPARFVPYGVRDTADGKVAVFQVWEWDGEQYDLNMYFVRDRGGPVETKVFRSRYYAISIDRLSELFREAGFVDIRRIDDQFFQPLVVARVG